MGNSCSLLRSESDLLEERIVLSLLNSPLFSLTPSETLYSAASLFKEINYKADDVIFEQGAHADRLYFISYPSDQVVLSSVNNKSKQQLVIKTCGDWIGDDCTWYMNRESDADINSPLTLPLIDLVSTTVRNELFAAQFSIYENLAGIGAISKIESGHCPRYSVTATALTDCTCVYINAYDLTKLYSIMPPIVKRNLECVSIDYVLKKILDIDFMIGIEIYSMNILRHFCHFEFLPNGTLIFEEGAQGNELFVIMSGAVCIHISKQQEHTLKYKESGYFGEMALFINIPRTASVTSSYSPDSESFTTPTLTATEIDTETVSTVLLVLQNEDLMQFIMNEQAEELYLAVALQRIGRYFRNFKIPFFDMLTDPQLNELIQISQMIEEPVDTVIVREGDIGDHFYIVVYGVLEVKRSASSESFELGTGSYFGEVALIKAGPRLATVTTKCKCVLLQLSRDDFNIFFDKVPQAVADFYIKISKQEVSIKHLILHPAGLQSFQAYLKSEYSEENLNFWKDAFAHNEWAFKNRELYLDPFIQYSASMVGKNASDIMPRVVSSAIRNNIKDKRFSIAGNDKFNATTMVPMLLKNKNMFSLSSNSRRADLKQYLISLLERCVLLHKQYIAVNAPEQVNIPAEFRNRIDKIVLEASDRLKGIFDYLDTFDDSHTLPSVPEKALKKSADHNYTVSSITEVDKFCTTLCKVFKEAEGEILSLMGNDSYARYKKDSLFEKFLHENTNYAINEYIPKDAKMEVSRKDKKSIINIMNSDVEHSMQLSVDFFKLGRKSVTATTSLSVVDMLDKRRDSAREIILGSPRSARNSINHSPINQYQVSTAE